ncbi:poly-gamma-glutamate biosynthesis protein PgsC/CapC [Haloarchaeobius amylolyticus]|uniref:poly-gamma-glutamate biosynthesis protein PgsC/CapC n=1 Tax=Haloarchaeobius amylolyticus TaxID=1198296 RepID=UPI002270E2C7|nr:poly-gamma-glutamate biosynthesis protein PgsC/CapC [Haloarchaeobius amylolyticus]
MWVATMLTILGLLSVATITQFTGYRLGGTITVPILAVYTLKDLSLLPVFVLSTLTAYTGLWLFRRRTLVAGRDELVVAMVVGTTVPLAIFLLVDQVGLRSDVIVFFGSILPGLAAYNYHQIRPEYRRNDLAAAVTLFVGLLVIGWVLVTPAVAAQFGTLTPPVLFSRTADIALLKNATAGADVAPDVMAREAVAVLFAAGLVLSERLRDRFGVRLGIITAVLLGIYALSNYWLLVLYLVLFVLAFGFVQAANYATLRYGRVLFGLTAAVAMLLAIPFVLWFPITRGLSAFFVANIAGVTAYNAHVTPPFERRLVLPLQVGVFVPSLLFARLFSTPQPQGFTHPVTLPVVVAGALLTAMALGLAYWYSVDLPDRAAVRSASVLPGGDS